MLNRGDIHNQNLADLVRVIAVLSEILIEKELTREEKKRIDYGTKVMKDVTEKCKFLKQN